MNVVSVDKVALKFYFDFLSQPSRALYILLKIGGKSFEVNLINLLQGENLTDEYATQINRFQKVPCIIDGQFKLAESIAILRYLTHKNYIKIAYYPIDDLKKRARIDEFLQWQHTAIRSSCSLYFRFKWFEKYLFGASAAAGKIEKYHNEMERDIKHLELYWLQFGKFICGNELTAADVFGACELEQIRCCGYKIRVKFPLVADWIENVRKELQPHFDVAHQTIYKYEQQQHNNSKL